MNLGEITGQSPDGMNSSELFNLLKAKDEDGLTPIFNLTEKSQEQIKAFFAGLQSNKLTGGQLKELLETQDNEDVTPIDYLTIQPKETIKAFLKGFTDCGLTYEKLEGSLKINNVNATDKKHIENFLEALNELYPAKKFELVDDKFVAINSKLTQLTQDLQTIALTQ